MKVELEVDLKVALKAVDKYIEKEAQAIADYVRLGKNLSSDNLFEIYGTADIENQGTSFHIDDRECTGIYVFIITKEVIIDKEKFNITSYASPLKDSNENCFHKNDVLYLGKSEKDISIRINQHISNGTKTTYSLRLNDDNRKCLYNNVKVVAFILKKDYEKYTKTMVSAVEVYLHEILKPKVGSKRA